mgnify:CR=1 FL=1
MSEIKDEKYSNGKIYKIVCNVTGMVYIGSTLKQQTRGCIDIELHTLDIRRYQGPICHRLKF